MSTQTSSPSFWSTLSPLSRAGLVVYLLVVTLVYILHPVSADMTRSGALMLINSWGNAAYDYSHGWLVAPICICLLIRCFRGMKAPTHSHNPHGLWWILFGSLLFLMSFHSHQWRLTSGALPFLLMGSISYFLGHRNAIKCAFPLFFFWFSIPVPGFQQATNGMQILATEAAHWCTNACGIQTIQEGTSLIPVSGEGNPFSIAGGCSGMRSLMALIMISSAWGYIAHKLPLWKRITMAVSAIPLAIIANAFRVSSIFICAEFINPAFASKTWHDWSGLLFFFPASLAGLFTLHSLLAGEIPFLKKRRTITRINNNGEEFS